jgi:Zn-dependent metalloprotease
VEFSDGSQSVRGWDFNLYNDNQKIVMGSLYADTGDLMEYSIPSYSSGEPQEKPNSATTMDSARLAAENEIRDRNGELSLNLVDSKVSPSGSYFFNYKRIIQGVPCTSDGITIDIDPGTGKVSRYFKSWHTPENAVAAQSVPAISRDAAIALVEREANACYPDSADSFKIVSADLRWMDLYHPDEFTPKPGVIPLAWYVRFDDKTIRTHEFPNPEEGWVDAQNGTLLSMEYFHNR